MWLLTNFGFFSVVRKEAGNQLTVRSRTRGDLDRLRRHFLPQLGPSLSHQGTDYPWRAVVDQAALAAAMPRIVEAIKYPNFKDEVALTLGKDRAKRYGKVWGALYDMPEDLAEPQPDSALPALWAGKVAGNKKLAYGGVVVNRRGQFLLREVAGHYDKYVWTYAKGRADPGESPRDTALREVWEEMGVRPTVLTALPGDFVGGTTLNRFFLMAVDEREVDLGHQCKETSGLQWAHADHARQLIGLTTNATGKTRDLAILDAALKVLQGHQPGAPLAIRTVALRTDWPTLPMPAKRSELRMDQTFAWSELGGLLRGSVSAGQEDKLFAYFEDNVLHLHLGCPAVTMYRVYFECVAKGLRATHCEVNEHPGRNLFLRDGEDAGMVRNLMQRLAG